MLSTLRSIEHCNKPWGVAQFEEYRPTIAQFCRENIIRYLDDDEHYFIGIKAPVKSGKREICEYLAVRDCLYQHRKHIFITAWYRIADEEQRIELKKHNMSVYAIKNNKDVETVLTYIRTLNSQNKKIVIHFDEADHGTGSKQNINKIWRETRRQLNKIKYILYSATIEEAQFSDDTVSSIDDEDDDIETEITETGIIIKYTPPEGYCGPQKFLEENLVYDADPFFVKVADQFQLSAQGKQIIADFRENLITTPTKNFILLRLCHGDGSGNTIQSKAIYQFLQNINIFSELSGIDIIADCKDTKRIPVSSRVMKTKVEYSNRYWWDRFRNPTIIVYDQTCSRSTELAAHDKIFATHDYRLVHTFTIISQAQERTNHYSQKYGEFQRIRVYGHKKTFELSAGQIEYAQYQLKEYFMKKIDRRISPEPMFQIRISATNELHPEYNEHYTKIAAQQILRQLFSLNEAKISARVVSKVKICPELNSLPFVKCNRDTFNELAGSIRMHNNGFHNFRNPFIDERVDPVSGRICGVLRSTVRPYEYNEVKMSGWGFSLHQMLHPRCTICYDENGDLGVCIRVPTGETKTINSMKTVKSMY